MNTQYKDSGQDTPVSLQAGSSEYYSLLFCKHADKKAIYPIYAFHDAISEIALPHHEPSVANAKLNWWRQELLNTYLLKPQHPATKSLASVIEQYDLPKEYFEERLDACEMDLNGETYSSFKALSLYCYRKQSVIQILIAQVLGGADKTGTKYAHELGIAIELAKIIQHVGHDASHQRIYLPHADLIQNGIYTPDIFKLKTSDALQKYLVTLCNKSNEAFQQALEYLTAQQQHQQSFGVTLGQLHQQLLGTLQKHRFEDLRTQYDLSPLVKLWRAWRISHRLKKAS